MPLARSESSDAQLANDRAEARILAQDLKVLVGEKMAGVVVAELDGAFERIESFQRTIEEAQRAGQIVVHRGVVRSEAHESTIDFKALANSAEARQRMSQLG